MHHPQCLTNCVTKTTNCDKAIREGGFFVMVNQAIYAKARDVCPFHQEGLDLSLKELDILFLLRQKTVVKRRSLAQKTAQPNMIPSIAANKMTAPSNDGVYHWKNIIEREEERSMRKTGWIVCLLSLLLLVGLMPATALAAGESEYGLWVNGAAVTADNAENVLGNGTVSYHANTNTLILNGAAIDTPYVSSFYAAGIYAEGDINITLNGNSSVNISSGQIATGIHANGVVKISGDGSLNVAVSGGDIETRAISTGYTEGEAGVVINGGTVTVKASGNRGIYAVYVDASYGTTPPTRYFQINGGTVELDAKSTAPYNCWATNTQPDFSKYEGYTATAILNSWENLAAYEEASWSYYRYIKAQPLVYDENGISEDKEHYQPAIQAADGYYEIKNAGNLFWFAEKLRESENNGTLNARLANSIAIPDGMNWAAMGVGTYGSPYHGTFDGAGYTISNLSAASDNMTGIFNNEGLFKTIGADGVVKDLGMINPSIKPDSGSAGAICGTNYGLIEDCYTLGGEISAPSIYGGGIAGENQGTIRRCWNTGTVTSSGSSIGGIAGYSHNGGEISDCYNTGNITGAWYVGGICGQLNGGTVENCYGIGKATATYPGYESTANPVVGARLNHYTVENTYYVNDTQNNTGGKTAAQFASGEVAYLLNANRSETIWGQTIGEQEAPVLGGATIYRGYEFCYSEDVSYSNDSSAVFHQKPEHRFVVLKCNGEDHWYACATEGCPEIYGTEKHKGGEATYFRGPLCEVCGTEYGSPKVSPLDSVSDISSENLTVGDKTRLEGAKDAVEQELADNGTEYSDEECAALEQRLEEIEGFIKTIENAEAAEEAILALPESASPDDTKAEEQINAAKEQYDALSEQEKALVSKEAAEKLENLLAQLVDYYIIEGNGSTWTKGSSEGLTFVANGAYSKFAGIEIDGTAISAENYTVESGSTVITLKPDYLDTLTAAEHTLSLIHI